MNEYSINGTDYTAFTNATPLAANTYLVRVKDGAGCYMAGSSPVTITAPPAPLEATVTASDFNGVQISCYGLADGAFSIAASGGNGNSYTNYQYSINNGAYTGTSNYTSQAAGTYRVKVKDGRGCIITKNVVLQEPAAVSLAVTGIAHLTCGADANGVINVQATGGITPYTYTINNSNRQGPPASSALSAAIYNLQVKDVNGCIDTASAAVNALDPAITATANITPVNCYGQAEGAVDVRVSGGDGSYQYQWNASGVAGASPQHLVAGDYTVRVTDGKGCTQSFSYTVPSQEKLVVQITAPQVCDGLSDGIMTVATLGGVTPYQYKLNDNAWSTGDAFNNLSAGNYHVKVQDANGCTVDNDIVIAKANTKPEVNFLVATNKNAFDTLVIKEISLPAPDVVSWTYSPEATLLGYSDGTPLIKFTQAGTYWVEMKAGFGDCTYTLSKDLTIGAYDPIAGPGYNLPVQVIDTVTLSPNPNDGNFHFKVTLNRRQQVVVYVFDLNGNVAVKREYSPTLSVDDQFSLGNSITGTYILRVIAVSESKDVRFVITR